MEGNKTLVLQVKNPFIRSGGEKGEKFCEQDGKSNARILLSTHTGLHKHT
jgi:hypothetical protein